MSFKQLVECIHFNLPGKWLGIYFHITSVIQYVMMKEINKTLSSKIKYPCPN